MTDIWIDVDTAVTVPVNVAPLIDDTDFKTREIAVAYNAAGMDLVWNFVTSAGVITQTAVTPTTAGVYDWTHAGDGMYIIEIPASGGVSVNNNAKGYGWFTGICTGVLPWRGPITGFRAAAINDALCDGGDNLDVNTVQLSGTAQTARDIGASVLLSSGTGTGQVSLSSGLVTLAGVTHTGAVIPTVTAVTNDVGITQAAADKAWSTATRALTDKAGFALSAAGVQAIWDALTSALTTAGSVGKKLADWVLGSDSKVLLSSNAQTGVTIPTVMTLTGHTPQTGDSYARLGAPAGASVSADVAGVQSDTNDIQTRLPSALDGSGYIQANAVTVTDKTGYALSTAGVQAIWDFVVEGTLKAKSLLRVVLSFAVGKASGGGTTTKRFRDNADIKDRIVATTDSNSNRTSVTIDGE